MQIRSRKQWAVSGRHKSALYRTSPGDLCVVYLTSDGGRYPSAFKAVFRIVSGPMLLKDRNQRNLFDQMYPWQVEIEIERELERAIRFQPFVSRMSFIRKPGNWGTYLQGHPMRKLDSADFALLCSAIGWAGNRIE
jgi:predicted RNA-binding protein